MPSKLPTVCATIPIGWTKEYALLYMLAALGDVDYPPEKFTAAFGVSDRGDDESKDFIQRLRNLLDNCNFPFKTHVIVTTPTDEDEQRWHQFKWVIRNLAELRSYVLESGLDYMWILGGDNPPLRSSIKRLLALHTDVASAILYQRPNKSWKNHNAYPLVFRHHWNLRDLDKPWLHNGGETPTTLNSEQKRLLAKAWLQLGFVKPVWLEKDWKNYKVCRNVVFGDACSLIKREVLEAINYEMLQAAYQSYDIQYMQQALFLGFETAVDMKLHCPHITFEGEAY